MIGRAALLPFGLVTAAAAFVAPATARAQCRLCETPTTLPDKAADESVRLQVEAGLDFDRLILSAPGPGSAVIRPNGSTSVSGTIAAISGRAMVGHVRVRGEGGRLIRVDLPSRIILHSAAGGSITIEEITTDLPPVPRLDPSGGLAFRFGGRLVVSGDAEGQYSGDIPITAEYL